MSIKEMVEIGASEMNRRGLVSEGSGINLRKGAFSAQA